MKKIIKKTLIIWAIFLMLLPTLSPLVAYAADNDNVPLNQERAGNYASNFAINFYENWSSITFVIKNSKGGSKAIIDGNYSFIWPIKEGEYSQSSDFGLRTWGGGKVEYHKGIDIAAPKGTDVYSSSAGTVRHIYNGCQHNYAKNGDCGDSDGYGNSIKIETDDGFLIVYGHLTSTEESLKEGDRVSQGQLIGKVGCTGWSTGDHLHFEFDVNDVSGVDEKDFIDRSIPGNGNLILGYRYAINPALFIKDGAKIDSTTTTSSSRNAEQYGEVKTEFDANVNPLDDVSEQLSDNEKYKFNNISWIGFVYRQSLYKSEDSNNILTGSGTNMQPNPEKFDDCKDIEGVKEAAQNSDILDVSKLISEGSILPGDILYINNGQGGGEYILYVGGEKIIYATGDSKAAPSGALKYEYIQYYMQRIKKNLLQGHEDDENYEAPMYGLTNVYRLKKDAAEELRESNTNLFFNGKGYYSYTQYDGIPKTITYDGAKPMEDPFIWLFSSIWKILKFLVNLALYIIRMTILGYINIVESLMRYVVLGLSGHNEDIKGFEIVFGQSGASAEAGNRLTVESIFFNQIPILDINFFNLEEAGGKSLMKEVLVQPGSSETKMVVDNDNIIVALRTALAQWYYIFRNFSIAALLLVLLYIGIKIAIAMTAQKKANYKKMLIDWVTAFLIVIAIHLFMYVIVQFNSQFLQICRNMSIQMSNSTLGTAGEKVTLYDAVRTKAYAFSMSEGLPATIIYIYLVYLLFRFLLIYFKRLITVYILTLSGSLMGLKHAIDKMSGKKTTSLSKWMKDYAFNVLLQTVHALIYVLFMGVATTVAETSVSGAIVAIALLSFMLKADKIIIKIFGLERAGSLADVNQPEKWSDVIASVGSKLFIFKSLYNYADKLVLGEKGLFTKIRYASTGQDNIKDAKKELEKRRYERIGKRARMLDMILTKTKINRLPIEQVFKNLEVKKKMGHGISPEMNQVILERIQNARKLKRQRFTRPIGAVVNTALGMAGTVASIGIAIDNPMAGIAVLVGARGRIKKYSKLNKGKVKASRYTSTINRAKLSILRNEREYRYKLDRLVNNQYAFEEAKNLLLDSYRLGNISKQTYYDQLKQLQDDRVIQERKEKQELKKAYNDMISSKETLKNAKAARRKNRFVNVAGVVTGTKDIIDVAQGVQYANRKDSKDLEKEKDKMDYARNLSGMEEGLGKFAKKLKEEHLRVEMANGKSQEDAEKSFISQFGGAVRDYREQRVNSAFVKQAVSEYMQEHKLSKVTADDVDLLLEKLKTKLQINGQKAYISDSVKANVEAQLRQSVTSTGTNKEYSRKEISMELEQLLSKENLLSKASSTNNITDPRLKANYDLFIQKLKEFYAYNEVSKIKNKTSLANIEKAIKHIKKNN